jgi:hypothetical protein
MRQVLLYLDANRLDAYRWRAGALLEEGRFPADSAGVEAFGEYVGKHPRTLFQLVADVADEGYRVEAVPHARGADRRALIRRKLGQLFYGSPLSTAVSLGREKTGRRDEKLLFAALTRPQVCEPWLAVLRGAQAQLAGVHSLPLAGATLARKLAAPAGGFLLIAVTTAGIRQTFLENGQIRFSRLTPFAAADTASTAAACAAEAGKLYQYLLGQCLVPHGPPLPVAVLAHPSRHSAFAQACTDTGELQFRILDLHGLGRSLGLKSLPQDSRSEALFLHLIARNPPREQLAPEAEQRFFRLARVRFALHSAAAAILLGCVLVAGVQFHEAMQRRGLAETTRAQAEATARKYAAIAQTFPPLPVASDKLHALVDRYEWLVKGSPPLEPLFFAISQALHAVPGVELERLEWRLGASPGDGVRARGSEEREPQHPENAGMRDIAVVHASLPLGMGADPRAQLKAIGEFAAALRKDGMLEVAVLREPADIESGNSLAGRGEALQPLAQPKFVMRLVRAL